MVRGHACLRGAWLLFAALTASCGGNAVALTDAAPDATPDGALDASVPDARRDATSMEEASTDAPPTGCFEQGPPCPEGCESIRGTPFVQGCFDIASGFELACREFALANGMVSCVVHGPSGQMYSLPSDSYRQFLEELPDWHDCPDGWQQLPYCE